VVLSYPRKTTRQNTDTSSCWNSIVNLCVASFILQVIVLFVKFKNWNFDIFLKCLYVLRRCVSLIVGWCFILRPVSESESEQQRARNGASESERDFFRERATIHTSEWKQAKFRMGRDFRFTVLYNGVAMSVSSTEYMGNQSQSSFHCFNTNTQQTWFVSGLPAVSNIDLLPSRLVLLGIILA